MLRDEPLIDDGHLRLRILERAALRQPADHRQVAHAAVCRGVRVEGQRRPELRAEWKVEALRSDTDDFVLRPVDLHRAAHQRRIPAESALPQSVAENHPAVSADGFFLRSEVPPDDRLNPDGRQEIRGHKEPRNALRLITPHQIGVPPLIRRQPLEHIGLLLPIQKVGGGDRLAPIDIVVSRMREQHDAVDVRASCTGEGRARR